MDFRAVLTLESPDQISQIIFHEADQPYVVVHFFDADGMSGKDLTEIDFLLSPTDPSATGDHDGLIVERIIDIRQSGVGTRGRLVDLGRTFHVQSFVRTLLVEDLDKFVKAGLLLKEIRDHRLGGFFSLSEVHAFVATVLLGMAGLDALEADAEEQPPEGQVAQVEQSVRGSEGHAVVAADIGGQAALLKKPLKYSECVAFPSRRKRLTSEEKPASVIVDRQRIAI